MADISRYLQAILAAVYGEEVRGSIHDAIEIINNVGEKVLTTGTAITDPTSSSEGYYDSSLYLNTDTYELWKCVGVDSWQSLGILKGADGDPGAPGEDGNRWYRGTGISGMAVNPTVYSGSGIADANPNDFYLNPSEGAVYHCVTGGDASTATWSFDFVMSGGGGGGSIVGWNQIQTSTGATKIAEITIDGNTTDVYAPQGGGGGASKLDDLSDVTITGTPAQGETLIANSLGIFENQPMPQGGHTMIPVAGDMATITALNNGNDNYVVNAYSAKRWSNCDAKIVLTTASKDADGVGTWNADNVWETDGVRSGWLWSAAFYQILEDGSGNRVTDTEIIPVFDVGDSETVGLLSYRIDDDVQYNGVDGGAVAFKFTGAIQSASGVKVGLKLVHQRTDVNDGTILT